MEEELRRVIATVKKKAPRVVPWRRVEREFRRNRDRRMVVTLPRLKKYERGS